MKKRVLAAAIAAMCLVGTVPVSVVPITGVAENESLEQVAANKEPDKKDTITEFGTGGTWTNPEDYDFILKNMTLNDVIELSIKSDTVVLKWSDFTDYKGEDISSESSLWEKEWTFKIDDVYTLIVCGKTDVIFPDHVYLSDNSKRRIDICTDDVKAFLNKGIGEDSLSISDDIKEHFRVYETYSDENTKPERRLVQDFKSIIRYYNVPVRFVFTEYDNIDNILASAYATKKYYVVEQHDGTLQCYNEHLKEMKSNRQTIKNGETVTLPYLDIPEKAFERFNDPDFVKKYISPNVNVKNVYYLSGESSHMGTAIYYRTDKGDYVYYNHYSIGEKLFPIEDFCKYQKAISDELAKHSDENGSGDIDISDLMDLSKYELKNVAASSENIKGDANCDGQVDLSDAVMIMQALANPNKYGIEGTAEHHLSEQGKLNGDMNGDGLTVGDAQSIQRKLLGLDETDSNQNIDNSEYLFGNEPSGSVMTPQRLALNCNSFCANGETLNVKMLMGDKYTYNQEHNSYPNYDSEGYPEYSIFATENFNKIDDERLIINGKQSEFTKTFSKDDMKSLDISQKEGDYSSYYNDTAEIDFSNYTSGSTGCISFRFGWKADGENPLNPKSDFTGTSQTMYFYVGENGTGISINGAEAAKKAYDEKSDIDIMFYDSPYVKWNDKEVMSNLYEKVRKPNDEVLPIIFKLSSSPNGNFEYKGKTLEEYGKERLSQNYLKYEQLLIYGDYLKYGEDIYKTGASDGTKWVKEFYEETIDDIGEELISKYIVGGEFLKDKLEADIAELKKKANDAYNEAEKAYLKSISDKAIKQLDKQNIKYEYKTDPKRLVIYVTADEFKSLTIDNVSRYGLDTSVANGLTVDAVF